MFIWTRLSITRRFVNTAQAVWKAIPGWKMSFQLLSLFHWYGTKEFFCRMKVSGMKSGQICINTLFGHHGWTWGTGMQLCSSPFLSPWEAGRKAQKCYGRGKMPGTSQRSCKCLMSTQGGQAGWKLCSTCCHCGLGIRELLPEGSAITESVGRCYSLGLRAEWFCNDFVRGYSRC